MAQEDKHNDHVRGGHGEGGEAFEEIHKAAVNSTLLLILLHLAGVFWTSRAHGENLVRAMFTSRKRRSG